MTCKFCDQYETNKRLNADLMTDCSDIKAKIKVGIVVEHYRDGYCVGQFRDKPVKLIFCPLCGKRVEES